MKISNLMLLITCSLSLNGLSQQVEKVATNNNNFILKDYLSSNETLNDKVDSIFNVLDQEDIVAQLIMPAVGKYGTTPDTIKMLISEHKIGGVLMLNGSKEEFTNLISAFESKNKKEGNLPFLYSADAEPSLVNRKIRGSETVLKAIEIDSIEKVYSVAASISNDLNEIGINYNFAPVVDMSSNKTVGYRGFGANPENLVPFSLAFIEQTQQQNIIATAKHFPGHGLVSGDTHKSLQVIDGELKELKNYPPMIENGVLSIMVGHLAVKNNPEFDTHGLPATCSEVIVTKLLRDSLNFKGLIVTDAMNMGGVIKVPHASEKAIDAGCDIILMPVNAFKAHDEIMKRYSVDKEFQQKVDSAAKRVIRMKICLGLI